jgi:hypothetical protein
VSVGKAGYGGIAGMGILPLSAQDSPNRGIGLLDAMLTPEGGVDG